MDYCNSKIIAITFLEKCINLKGLLIADFMFNNNI